MNRFDLASVFGLVVLTLGLASCSPEQKTSSDSYKTPPPVIVTGKGEQAFIQWERQSDKTLDLQDAFDLSRGAPARVEITTNCTREKVSYSGKFNPDGRRPIHVFQIIPQEMLSEDLSKNSFSCTWELALYNQIGSRHLVRLPPAPVSDSARGEVTVENSANNESSKFIQLSQTGDFKIRYRNAANSTAEILCADIRFESLGFDKVLELNQFNFRKPIYNAEKSEDTLEQNPQQRCRIVIKEGEQIRQISSQVTLYMPPRPLEFIASSIAANPRANPDFFRYTGGEMAEITIYNPSKSARLLQIPRVSTADLDAVFTANSGTIAAVQFRRNGNGAWVSVHLASSFSVLKEETAGWTLVLNAKTALSLRLRFHEPSRNCGEVLTGFKVQPNPLTITELTEGWVKVSSHPLKIPEYSWNYKPIFSQLQTVERACF